MGLVELTMYIHDGIIFKDEIFFAIVALLGMGEESWSLVRNHLHKELTSWSEEYINLVGGIERFEELKRSLLVDVLSKVHNFIIMSFFVKITF